MKKNKQAFSLLVAIWLVLITTLLAFTILEYMIPFWRNIKWVENSTKAYYLANSWIERWLYFFSNRVWNQIRNDTSRVYWASSTDYRFQTTSSWTIIPPPWRWNSDFDNNWNKIWIGDPIQLSIWYWTITNIDWLAISFRVPDINNDSINTNDLTTWSTHLINWQLLSWNNTLNSINTTTFIRSNINWSFISLRTRQWVLLDWTAQTFEQFFSINNCSVFDTECILKFSVINDLVSWSSTLPYLEWRVSFCNWLPIMCPNNWILRYSIIDSQWKSSGFVRDLNVRVPQKTVSEAFDFTVFQ